MTDDLQAARDAMRPFIALYVGGMGSREQNFYNQLVLPLRVRGRGAQRPGPLPRRQARRGDGGAARRADRHRLALRAARPRARAPRRPTATPASGRSGSRRWRSTARGASSSCAWSPSLPRPEPPRLRLLLGAFGDPGHAFPMLALGRAPRRARARRRAADVGALAGRRRARGRALRARARVPRLPHARAAAQALRGRRARGAGHDPPGGRAAAARGRGRHPDARAGPRRRARRGPRRDAHPPPRPARAARPAAVLDRRAPAPHRARPAPVADDRRARPPQP